MALHTPVGEPLPLVTVILAAIKQMTDDQRKDFLSRLRADD